MKRILLLLPLCALFLSCTKDFGTPITKEFAISNSYSKIDISDGFHVTMSDEVSSVVVTVGEKAIDRAVVKVQNGTLYIHFKWGTHYQGNATAIIPSSMAVNKISLSGSSAIYDGELSGGDAELELSGASTFTGTANVADIDIEMSGSSQVVIMGNSQSSLDIDLSGSSTLDAFGLITPEVEGDMRGNSMAKVTCCTSLEVDLTGDSKLTYQPVDASCRPVINCTSSGGSTVSSL